MRLISAVLCATTGLVFIGCVHIEWRGGMTPSLQWQKREESHTYVKPEAGRLSDLLENNSSSAEWPDFRGPTRRGIARSQGVPIDWRKKPNLIWRREIGPGHSSLILASGRLYTMEQEGDFETLTCRSMRDGGVVWKYRKPTKLKDSMGGIGPRSSPVAAQGKIYALHSNGTLSCLQASTGDLIWERETLEPEYEYPHWGLACSPLVLNGMVIVSPGGAAGAVKSFDAETGRPAWVSKLKGNGVYLSPSAMKLAGRLQVVVAVEGKLAGLEPSTGETLWEHPWKIFMVNTQITQPLELSEDVLLVSAGYGKGAEAVRIEKDTQGFTTQRIWKSKNLKTKFSSPVFRNGYVYGFNESSLTCIEAQTGGLMWRGEKYGYGRILLVEDKLLILGNTGAVSVVEANPNGFVEVSSRQLLKKERCWNGPLLVGGFLVLRNGSEIRCYDYKAR
ncbi:MAG: hypothetical protein CMI30_03870 [Opitutae bacterium]|nr:hypothetical protein [Opitutae bacterium]